ncbi:MAG: aldehyde dehydrogenase family protein, partial [Rhizobiaceae bacterium]|nr:aldehyde dehydrogenase family protein [Rhizobiaceae bacterium]
MNISLLINGEDRPAASGRTYDRVDPFTEKLASRAPAAGLDDVATAVGAASAAFPAWSKTGPTQRRAILMKAADVLDSKVGEFTQLMIAETGATAPWAGFNVMLAANIL